MKVGTPTTPFGPDKLDIQFQRQPRLANHVLFTVGPPNLNPARERTQHQNPVWQPQMPEQVAENPIQNIKYCGGYIHYQR